MRTSSFFNYMNTKREAETQRKTGAMEEDIEREKLLYQRKTEEGKERQLLDLEVTVENTGSGRKVISRVT